MPGLALFAWAGSSEGQADPEKVPGVLPLYTWAIFTKYIFKDSSKMWVSFLNPVLLVAIPRV